jgi:hypothetical protein
MMKSRFLVLMGFGGACIVSSTSACVVDADIASSESSSGADESGGGGCHSTVGAGGSMSSSAGGGGFSSTSSTSGVGGFSSTSGTGGSLDCGVEHCDGETQFCQRVVPGLDGRATYACKAMPAACAMAPTCECLSSFVCEDLCGGSGCASTCDENPGGGFIGTCLLP